MRNSQVKRVEALIRRSENWAKTERESLIAKRPYVALEHERDAAALRALLRDLRRQGEPA